MILQINPCNTAALVMQSDKGEYGSRRLLLQLSDRQKVALVL